MLSDSLRNSGTATCIGNSQPATNSTPNQSDCFVGTALKHHMGLKHDFINGVISLVIGVAITKLTASGDEYDTTDVLLAVAITSFFSGFFTSYFAK